MAEIEMRPQDIVAIRASVHRVTGNEVDVFLNGEILSVPVSCVERVLRHTYDVGEWVSVYFGSHSAVGLIIHVTEDGEGITVDFGGLPDPYTPPEVQSRYRTLYPDSCRRVPAPEKGQVNG